MLAQLQSSLSRRPYLIALILVIALLLWFASGIGQPREKPARIQDSSVQTSPVRVQTQMFKAEPTVKRLTLYGMTEPARQTVLRAQISGEIEALLKEKGVKVKGGSPCSD
ncbi:hypothetical protein [Dongshaea marina]|uniref:hypothetical protein n=1 Tax=Dongshaea marina TaxID=2047966 RepID=UPI000D3EB290|nr:hypothetical protein [Dongshaea marina]